MILWIFFSISPNDSNLTSILLKTVDYSEIPRFRIRSARMNSRNNISYLHEKYAKFEKILSCVS